MATVCMLVHGHKRYFQAARAGIRAVLARTPFDVLVGLGPGAGRLRLRDARIATVALDPAALPGIAPRPARFLLKFRLLAACLERAESEHVLLLDADTLFVAPTDEADVERALAGRRLGLAEQTCIRGEPGTDRAGLARWYAETMLPFFDPAAAPSPAFRYYNSGVVVGTRAGFQDLTTWALERIGATPRSHEVGADFVGDQDYVLYWANHLHPEACTRLDWTWNHCAHWDADFPRMGARILHFSNFTFGPRKRAVRAMRALARSPR